MKLIKLLVPVLALGLTAVLQAQDAPKKGGGGRGAQTPEARVAQIQMAVGTLSAEQKTKITALLTKSAADMAAMSQEDRQAKGADMRTALNKEIRALLTADQQKKFDEMPAPGARGGGGGGKKGN